jgi:hypothetical protein
MGKIKICLCMMVFSLTVFATQAACAVTEAWVFKGYAVGKHSGNETALSVMMPEVIRLDNGTYRMYYGAVDPTVGTGGACIKYAESSDGIR